MQSPSEDSRSSLSFVVTFILSLLAVVFVVLSGYCFLSSFSEFGIYYLTLAIFTLLFGVFVFIRSPWFVVPVFLLEILFLWTARFFLVTSSIFNTQIILYLYYTGAPFGLDVQNVTDILAVSLLLLTFVFTYLHCNEKPLLRSIQIVSLSLVPLGFEILIFDRSELYLGVVRFLSFPTNAELMVVSLMAFVEATAILQLPFNTDPL